MKNHFRLGRSSLRRQLLEAFFRNPSKKGYVRELAHELKVDPTNLSRELRALEKFGIFRSEKSGLQRYYSLNQNYALYHELAAMVSSSSTKKKLASKARFHLSRSKIAAYCKRHHIRKLSLFGSVLRDDFRSDSDVDVLVEFEPKHGPGFIGLYELEQELSKLLGNHRLDLVTPKFLNHRIRDRVLSQAEIQYAA